MINNAGTNNVNGSMSTPSSASNAQSQGLKTYFKAPEGRYKLHSEKTHPSGLLPYAHGKSVTQITLAELKEKQPQLPHLSSTSYSATSGVRYVASKFLGTSNGSRGISGFAGGSATSKVNGASRSVSLTSNGSHSVLNSSFDGKGTYLIFNVGDTLYTSDLSSHDKDPVKTIHFSNSNPICHAFDSEAKDGHDLLIGLSSGDVYSVTLRQQLQDVGKKLVGAQHYNKDGSTTISRCTSVTWIPGRDGAFVVAHADGNLYVYEKGKDVTGESVFPVIKDQNQFSVAHAKSSKSNPIARWHICRASINAVAFSADGKYLATVGRDGYLRVFDYHNELLFCGGKSYYGALLCCAWSADGKYILTGGEDDLVQVWSIEDRKIVAWGEGHNSWVSGVSFDSYQLPPTAEDMETNVVYRFGSVGQDAQLLLWDLAKDEIVAPLRRCLPGGSPTFSVGSQSSHWDNTVPAGTLMSSPRMRDVPKLSPIVAHRVHSEPLSGLVFTQESILTSCREGNIKVWLRPGHHHEIQASNMETIVPSSVLKEKTSLPVKAFSHK